MAKSKVIPIIILIIGIPRSVLPRIVDNVNEHRINCPEELRINLTGVKKDEVSGFVVKLGYVFPPISIWKNNESGEIFGCKCYPRMNCSPIYCPGGISMFRRVSRDCKSNYVNEPSDLNSAFIYSINNSRIEKVWVDDLNFWMRPGSSKCTWLGKNVQVVFDKNLPTVSSENDFYIKKNGSIYTPRGNISDMYNFESYCLCDYFYSRIYKPDCNKREINPKSINEGNCFGCNGQGFHFWLKLLIVFIEIGNSYLKII